MESSGRNRSEGWRHAKVDGHENERHFGDTLGLNIELLTRIESLYFASNHTSKPRIEVDGARHVSSILGGKTTSKVDLTITWDNGDKVNISLKKSDAGQVWLVSVARFISAMEFYLGEELESIVKAGLALFIGGPNLEKYRFIFESAVENDLKTSPELAKQEIHQNRLLGDSLKRNCRPIWEGTLAFFNANIDLISKLSFSRGFAKNENDYADVIVYNQKRESEKVFKIGDLVHKANIRARIEPIKFGPRNGGSTLLLPTGFLQMHHPQGENQMQFHHQFKKVQSL